MFTILSDLLLSAHFRCEYFFSLTSINIPSDFTNKHLSLQKRVLQLGGTARLVEIMKTSDYEKLLYHTARLLKVLSTCPDNKRAIVDSGLIFSVRFKS